MNWCYYQNKTTEVNLPRRLFSFSWDHICLIHTWAVGKRCVQVLPAEPTRRPLRTIGTPSRALVNSLFASTCSCSHRFWRPLRDLWCLLYNFSHPLLLRGRAQVTRLFRWILCTCTKRTKKDCRSTLRKSGICEIVGEMCLRVWTLSPSGPSVCARIKLHARVVWLLTCTRW